MRDKWILDPINEDFIGWNILEYNPSIDDRAAVAVVLVDDSLEKGKDNAALISTAPELLSVCKKIFNDIDRTSPIYEELENVIYKAEGIEGNQEALGYFDDMDLTDINYFESVINIDFAENKCTYMSNATMKETFSFHDFGDDVGLISLNISGENNYNEDIDEQILRYPIGHLLSSSVYEDFIEYISGRYPQLKDFMSDFDNDENEELSLREFINNIFFDDFADNYIRELSLSEYLNEYPLVFDTDELYIEFNLPKFLENCPHSLHADIDISHNGQNVKGIIFYIEKEDKFYIFNQEDNSVSFFMIPNDEQSKNNAFLKYIDLIKNNKR